MIGTDKLSRPLEVEITIPVRTYDIDFAGIVSNIVYIKWLEDLRLKFLDEHLPLETEIARGSVPIVSKTEIEYKRPIKLFESVIGRLWIANFGRIKYTIQAEIISNNGVAEFKYEFIFLLELSPLNPPNLGDFKLSFSPRIGGWGAKSYL